MRKNYSKFERLTFDSFKNLAKQKHLSRYEKIGFPDSYRKGYEKHIFRDICAKLTNLEKKEKTIVDIGPGCRDLPFKLIELCEKQKHELILVDSREMLSLLPDKKFIEKYPCKFPTCKKLLEKYEGKVDAIVIYSVLQHVFMDSNPFNFLDKALRLLNEGGQLLLADIPNITKRKRFFSSSKGIETHKKFTGKDELPVVEFMMLDEEKIDDGVLFAILQRYRNAGYETYLLPQGSKLPLATRREDILIVRN